MADSTPPPVTEPTNPDLTNAVLPGLLRRLGAIFYDSVLVFGLVFFAFAVVYLPLAIGFGMEDSRGNPAYTLYLMLVAVSFHLWFWTHGGQTLGMRSWRLKVVDTAGGPISLKQAVLRYLVAVISLAVFGLGFVWSLFDRQKRTWHDIASSTRLVLLQKRK